MSAFNDLDIICEQCSEEFRGTVWTAIHAGVDPELKDLLLGGELNMVMCPKCSHVAFQDQFLIYQEPADELIAYVYPETQEEHRDELTKIMIKGFDEAQATLTTAQRISYEPVLFFGLESLVEMINDELNWTEQSDVAEAICKEKKIGYIRIKPAESRRLKLPRVLPREGTSTKPTRDAVLAGMKRLVAENALLDLYGTRLMEIESDASWTLSPS
jgi:hypothetical protein